MTCYLCGVNFAGYKVYFERPDKTVVRYACGPCLPKIKDKTKIVIVK